MGMGRGEAKSHMMGRTLFGLVRRREAWCLTWRGRLFIASFLFALFFGGVVFCAPFLSQNQILPAEVLVVEGWLPDYALKDAAKEFKRGKYRYVISAGGPLLDGYYLSGHKSYAELAASTLVALGVRSDQVIPVSCPYVLRGRSRAHAQAVKEWIDSNDAYLQRVNVYSLGVHARRSRLLFQKVLGDKIDVGVIAHPDATYDCHEWWRTSEGFRAVTEEALGYLWARVFEGH